MLALISNLINKKYTSIAEAKTLSNEITTEQVNQWSSGNVSDWAMESFAIAKNMSYNIHHLKKIYGQKSNTGVIIDDRYNKKAALAIKTQLQKAGIRVAYVLNKTLQ